MRKRINLLLALTVLVVVAEAMVAPVLSLPPSSGGPTPISSLGTIVIANSFRPSGTEYTLYVYIFSTSGPFYVQKVNMGVFSESLIQPIYLAAVYSDTLPSTTSGGIIYHGSCLVPIIPSFQGFWAGNIITLTPSLMTDPSGANAVPAASDVVFQLSYNCGKSGNFPSAMSFSFEATILAPTTATVSICASENPALTSCSPYISPP